MLKNLLYTLSLLIVTGAAIRPQNTESARLRVMQLTFDQPNDGASAKRNAHISIDSERKFTNVHWSFLTEYINLLHGDHTVTVQLIDNEDLSLAKNVTLKAGGKYTLIACGNYSHGGVMSVLVDERALPVTETNSTVIFVNMYLEPVDVFFDNQLVGDSLPSGEFMMTEMPLVPTNARVNLSGTANTKVTELQARGMPDTVFYAVLYGTEKHPVVSIQRFTDLTVSAYLTGRSVSDDFGAIAAYMMDTGVMEILSGQECHTLFLPAEGTYETVDKLKRCIIPGNFPQNELLSLKTITSIDGTDASIDFGEPWQIDGMPILWNIHLADGMIYALDVPKNNEK